MTKKDCELIAMAIRRVYRNTPESYDMLRSITNALADDNPRFDRDKFVRVATVGE